MDFKQQEYFVAIVEAGSLSKAARQLYVSQPTLSQFLAKLESSMGTQLILRNSSNALSLTEAGSLFYEYSKKALVLRDEFDRRLSDLNETAKPSLMIGNNLEKAMVMLNDIVSELSVKYPDLKVQFQYGNPYQLQEMVVNGKLDMGFSCYNHKNPQLDYLDFPAFEMLIVLPKDHPLAYLSSEDYHNVPRIKLKDLEQEKFILVKAGTVTGDITREYCEENGVDLDVCIEVYNGSFALASVACGLGIGIFPPETLDNRNEDVRYIGMDPPLYYKRALYYSKSTYHTTVFRDYIRVVRRLAETGSLFRKL